MFFLRTPLCSNGLISDESHHEKSCEFFSCTVFPLSAAAPPAAILFRCVEISVERFCRNRHERRVHTGTMKIGGVLKIDMSFPRIRAPREILNPL